MFVRTDISSCRDLKVASDIYAGVASADKVKDRYYRLLGVHAGAGAAEVKSAFRRLAHRYHPDISTEENAREKFIEIVDAYRALTSSENNPGGKSQPQNTDEQTAKNCEENVRTPLAGRDCHMEVALSVEELYWGVEIKVDPVSGCHGRRSGKGWRNSSLLKIKVKRGTPNGALLRVRGKGDSGVNGGPPGDLVLTIKLKPHDRYEIRGDNIYVDMPLSRWEANEGAIIDLTTPGGRIEVDVPAGITSGQSIHIPQRGLPHSEFSSGDLFAVARLVDVEKRTHNRHKWPHIPHNGAMRWQAVGKPHGSHIDVRV